MAAVPPIPQILSTVNISPEYPTTSQFAVNVINGLAELKEPVEVELTVPKYLLMPVESCDGLVNNAILTLEEALAPYVDKSTVKSNPAMLSTKIVEEPVVGL